MDYSDSSKSSRIKSKHKNSKNDNKHHHHHDRDRTRDKEKRDRERERDIERDRDRHYHSKSRGSRVEREKEKRHKNKHSSKKEKSHLSKNHSNRHNHSSYKDSGNSKSKHYSKSSHKSRSKYSSSSSSSSSSSNRSSSNSSKQKGESTNNLNDTQTFNPYMIKNIIPPMNQTKYQINPMNLMGFPSMMGGMIPMPGLNINMIDNQPDKIVKDQNFLNSEEKLFESIVNHEMSLKNLYSDCQFSEKLMGSLLFRNLKKLIFDSNTVIFTDNKNEEKENVPSINEIIDNRINNLLKEKYLKINFSGLDGIYNKIIEERKQKLENERKIEKTK